MDYYLSNDFIEIRYINISFYFYDRYNVQFEGEGYNRLSTFTITMHKIGKDNEKHQLIRFLQKTLIIFIFKGIFTYIANIAAAHAFE